MTLSKTKLSALLLFVFAVVAAFSLSQLYQKVFAASCAVPSPSYGTATMTFNVPKTSPGPPQDVTYRVWVRMAKTTNGNDTVKLELNNECYTVGGPSVPTTWQNDSSNWFNKTGGTGTSAPINQRLTEGTDYTVKLLGNKPGVKVDRIILVKTDGATENCVTTGPTGKGENCAGSTPNSVPQISIVTPAAGAQVSGLVEIKVDVTDTDLQRVILKDATSNKVLKTFLRNPSLESTAPNPFISGINTLTYNWDTNSATLGVHNIIVEAIDGQTRSPVTSQSRTVDVKDNGIVTIQNAAGEWLDARRVRATVQNMPTPDKITFVVKKDGRTVKSIEDRTRPFCLKDLSVSFVEGSGTYCDAVTDLPNGMGYKIEATAFYTRNSTQYSKNATPVDFDVNIGGPVNNPPTKPDGLAITNVTQTSLDLDWNDSNPSDRNDRIKMYEVYRTDEDASPPVIFTVEPANSASSAPSQYAATGLQCNTVYTFRVRAYDSFDQPSLDSDPITQRTTPCADTEAPTTPKNILVTPVSARGASRLTIAWDESTDNVAVKRYIITRKNPDGTSSILPPVRHDGTVGRQTTTDFDRAPSARYVYQIVAEDAARNKSVASELSTGTTLPPTDCEDRERPTDPGNTKVINRYDNGFQIGFDASSDPGNCPYGVGTYHIWNETGSDASQTYRELTSGVTNVNVAIYTLAKDTPYKLRLSAKDRFSPPFESNKVRVGNNNRTLKYKRGDANGDGRVDILDISMVGGNQTFGRSYTDDSSLLANSDFTGNRTIDVGDISAIANGWGR